MQHHTIDVNCEPHDLTAQDLAQHSPDELNASLRAAHAVYQALETGDEDAIAEADQALTRAHTAMINAANQKAPSE